MNILRKGSRVYTLNLSSGRVYGERIIKSNGYEYREWVPDRSKLAAALICGLKEFPIKQNSKILYLGASTGTTVSHISDIIGKKGIVYAIEFAERVFRNLIVLCSKRKNIVPIFEDCRKPEKYYWVEECDVVYCDIADPQETEIAIRNCKEFLKENGYLMLAIKSQSIDVTKKPAQVYKEEIEKLKKNGFKIIKVVNIEKFQKDHAFILAQI